MTSKIKWRGKIYEYLSWMSFGCPVCNRDATGQDEYNKEFIGIEYLGAASIDGGSNWTEYYKCKNCGKRYCFMDSNW